MPFSSVKATTPIAGNDDSEFIQAVDFWLDDNDRQSLPALARLARDGNRAARFLLSRIETTDRALKPFVAALSRGERLELFRADSGSALFPPSWLKVESERGNPLARALFDSTATRIDIPAIEMLYALGEIEATEHLVRKIAVDGSQVDREALAKILPSGSELKPYLRGFYLARSGMTTGKTGLQVILGAIQDLEPESVVLDQKSDTKTAEKYVDYGYQSGKQTIGDWNAGRHYDAIANWTLNAAQALPLARLCRQACPSDQMAGCAVTGFGLIGGYYEIIRFDSPLESIISQDRFLRSDRAYGMVKRRIATAKTEANLPIFSASELSDKSQCLASAVLTLQ